jgi:hypothetical protein
VTIFHAESIEDCGDIGFLTETDSGTIFIAVDLDAEKLACRAEVRDLVFLWEFRFDFDRGFGSSLWLWHGDIVDIAEVSEYHRCGDRGWDRLRTGWSQERVERHWYRRAIAVELV